jgi:hypothetical protein
MTDNTTHRFLPLRRAGDQSTRPLYHAVTPDYRMDLCTSAKNMTRVDWLKPPGEVVTCPSCLSALDRFRRREDEIEQLGKEARARAGTAPGDEP